MTQTNVRRFLGVALLGLVILPSVAAAQFFGSKPKTYDDCVLEAMKGVTSDLAARSIMQSCSNKFPDSSPHVAPKSQSLPQSEQGLVKAKFRAALVDRTAALVNVYNGSRDWTVAKVIVRLTPRDSGAGLSIRDLAVDTHVDPLSTHETLFTTGDDVTLYKFSLLESAGAKRP